MANKPKTGEFFPKKIEKILPESDKLIYKSGLERKFMLWCDANANILKWAYEPKTHRMPYDFIDVDVYLASGRTVRKKRVYHPDFMIHHLVNGKIVKCLIEIKPYSQSVEPKRPKQFSNEKAEKRWMTSFITYKTNEAKWRTCERYCKQRSYQFHVITEKVLNPKQTPPKYTKKAPK